MSAHDGRVPGPFIGGPRSMIGLVKDAGAIDRKTVAALDVSQILLDWEFIFGRVPVSGPPLRAK